MTDAELLEGLQKEIGTLAGALYEINPNWFEETLREFTNEGGVMTESVCLATRAAIKMIKQQNLIDK